MNDLEKSIAERYYHKRRLGVAPDSRSNSVEIEIESGLAEKFACEEFGCEFNNEIYDGSDGGFDFIYRGYKIDVKWMGKKNDKPRNPKYSRLIVDTFKLEKQDSAEIYIAVGGCKLSGYCLLGWCTKEDLLNHNMWISNKQDANGSSLRYAIPVKELRSMQELFDISEKA